MKHLKFLAAVCCMLAVFTACEKNEPNDNGNGINSSGSVSAPTGTENGHGYVDLGLPSGTKWATCNLGATNPEEYGNYYAWGETEPKTIYSYSTYYGTNNSYNWDDSYIVLDCVDDAANVNWGGTWHMPTDEECRELIDNCTYTWTDDYNGTGVAGGILKSKINGNSIFLPAAGYRSDADLSLAGYIGYYWSSYGYSRYSRRYSYVPLSSNGVCTTYKDSEYYGQSVRPVLYDSDYNATGTENGYGYVDLGLPSGLKWATCNVGASAPEEYGDYYAWGETEPKTTYDWNTYKWCNGTEDTLTKYNISSRYGTVDNKTVLELADDAARANWGGAWRMPTDEECTELCENCEWTWTFLNGHVGYQVKGTNGKSIFLPAAGYRSDDELNCAGYCNYYYWSSSLNMDHPYYACGMGSYAGYLDRGCEGRYFGKSVRPVLGE